MAGYSDRVIGIGSIFTGTKVGATLAEATMTLLLWL